MKMNGLLYGIYYTIIIEHKDGWRNWIWPPNFFEKTVHFGFHDRSFSLTSHFRIVQFQLIPSTLNSNKDFFFDCVLLLDQKIMLFILWSVMWHVTLEHIVIQLIVMHVQCVSAQNVHLRGYISPQSTPRLQHNGSPRIARPPRPRLLLSCPSTKNWEIRPYLDKKFISILDVFYNSSDCPQWPWLNTEKFLTLNQHCPRKLQVRAGRTAGNRFMTGEYMTWDRKQLIIWV